MQTLVHEPFHYGRSRIDFSGRCGVAGEPYSVFYHMRYGAWMGTALAGRFVRRLGYNWTVELKEDGEWGPAPEASCDVPGVGIMFSAIERVKL